MKQSLKVRSDSFTTGDEVIINQMFFRNHGLKFQEFKGMVKGIVPTWESKLPAVRVSFKFNPAFFQFQNNGYMKFNTAKENGDFVMLVRIHPMYLEKVK
jgi:hypothetical protein